MDDSGHIYMDEPEAIPAEDTARLDGYLRGRSESDSLRKEAEKEAAILKADKERLLGYIEEWKAKVRQHEERP